MFRDRSLLRAEDLIFLSGGFDLSLPRFTQNNVIIWGRKTRAQILGKPVSISGK